MVATAAVATAAEAMVMVMVTVVAVVVATATAAVATVVGTKRTIHILFLSHLLLHIAGNSSCYRLLCKFVIHHP